MARHRSQARPRFGVSGATIVKGVVTDVIDVAALVDAMPSSFTELVRGASDTPTNPDEEAIGVV